MQFIRDLCVRWNAYCITDEIYEHILYDGAEHISMAALEGMRDRTITVNGMSKTYSVTGWRVGWCVAPPEVSNAIRKVHDFLTVGAPAPLQQAGAVALRLPAEYYSNLAARYLKLRDRTLNFLEKAGFRCFKPRGAYYIMTDFSAIAGDRFADDVEFGRYLVEKIGVAAVPGSSFYSNPRDGARQIRFCFCKTDATLAAAEERLGGLRR